MREAVSDATKTVPDVPLWVAISITSTVTAITSMSGVTVGYPHDHARPQAGKARQPGQYQRFVEMTRELGAESDEDALGRAFDRVAAGKPGHPKPEPKKRGKKPPKGR